MDRDLERIFEELNFELAGEPIDNSFMYKLSAKVKSKLPENEKFEYRHVYFDKITNSIILRDRLVELDLTRFEYFGEII